MEVYIDRSGQQIGPFSEQQIQSMLNSGMVTLTDSAWRQGASEWLPLHQILDVCPPPPAQPPAIPAPIRFDDTVARPVTEPLRAGSKARITETKKLSNEEKRKPWPPSKLKIPPKILPSYGGEDTQSYRAPKAADQPIAIGGWLAFFCFILIALNPLLTVFGFFSTHKLIEALRPLDPEAAKTLDSFNSLTGLWSFTLAAFSVLAGILLVRRARNAMVVAKIFTAAVPITALLTLLAAFGSSSSAELGEGMVQGGVEGLIKSLGFFAIWFTYLCRSKRVKNNYTKEAAGTA